MIDEKVFKDSWVLLCDRFNRAHSQPLMLAYFKSLTARLSTEQFKAAANRIFMEREFFPRPIDFVEGNSQDREALAVSEWEKVQDAMRGFCKFSELSPEARHVVALLGGETKLRNTSLDAVQYVRRDFLQMYGDAARIAEREGGNRIEPTPEGNRLTDRIMNGTPRLLP